MYFPTNYKKELNDIKQYREYMGIIRKEFPKWQGWELIDSYKSKNIKVQDIDDKVLDVLVDSFYLFKYIYGFIIVKMNLYFFIFQNIYFIY